MATRIFSLFHSQKGMNIECSLEIWPEIVQTDLPDIGQLIAMLKVPLRDGPGTSLKRGSCWDAVAGD